MIKMIITHGVTEQKSIFMADAAIDMKRITCFNRILFLAVDTADGRYSLY